MAETRSGHGIYAVLFILRPHTANAQLLCVNRQCKYEMVFQSFWDRRHMLFFIYLAQISNNCIRMFARSQNQAGVGYSSCDDAAWQHCEEEQAIFHCFWHHIGNSLRHAELGSHVHRNLVNRLATLSHYVQKVFQSSFKGSLKWLGQNL